jgi:hypothetical protein
VCFQRVELLVVVVVVQMPSGSQVKIAQPTKKEEKRGAGMQRGCTKYARPAGEALTASLIHVVLVREEADSELSWEIGQKRN